MTKHFSLRFALSALTLCGALSACVIRTAGPYDDCEIDPQYCGGGRITCFVDGDCPTGLICDGATSSCMATSTCYPGQSCPRNHHCEVRNTCVPDDWTGGTGAGGRGGSGQGGASTGGAAGSGTGTGTGGRSGSGGASTGGVTGGSGGSGGAFGNHGTGGVTGQPATGGTTGAAGAGPGCTPA